MTLFAGPHLHLQYGIHACLGVPVRDFGAGNREQPLVHGDHEQFMDPTEFAWVRSHPPRQANSVLTAYLHCSGVLTVLTCALHLLGASHPVVAILASICSVFVWLRSCFILRGYPETAKLVAMVKQIMFVDFEICCSLKFL